MTTQVHPQLTVIYDGKMTLKNYSDSKNFKIVGYEKNGLLICAWSDVTSKNVNGKKSCLVTYIGIAELNSLYQETLLVHDELVNVVNCTINEERTLLGFVTATAHLVDEDDSDANNNATVAKTIYKAFLSEIRPQNRTFALNIDRPYYIRLQFLYEQFGNANRPATTSILKEGKQSHMLVIIHGESIGLYHIPCGRAGQGRMVMIGQPKTDQVTSKHFIFAQWDIRKQQLYVVKQSKTKLVAAMPANRHRTKFTAYDMRFDSMANRVLDVTLGDLGSYTVTEKCRYYDSGAWDVIPDRSMNGRVVLTSIGELCVCLQYPSNEMFGRSEYKVFIIHHKATLHVTVTDAYVSPCLDRITFMAHNNLLLAWTAGGFTHLLNTSKRIEPVHQILIHDFYQPDGASRQFNPQKKRQIYCCIDKDKTTLLLDAENMIVYRLDISHEMFLYAFAHTRMPQTRLAIIHYATFHKTDLSLLRKIVQLLTNDTRSPEIRDIFLEFLLGSTNATLRHRIPDDILQMIPCTQVETEAGQYEKSRGGDRLCSALYGNMRETSIALKWAKSDEAQARRVSADGSWQNLRLIFKRRNRGELGRNLKWETIQEARLSMTSLEPKQSHEQRQPSLVGELLEQEDNTQKAQSKSDTILGPAPFFLKSEANDHFSAPEEDILIANCLRVHIRNLKPEEQLQKIINVTDEYIKALKTQIRLLCHLIYSVYPEVRNFTFAEQEVPENVIEVFHLYERYYLTLLEMAMPAPPGFNEFFTQLAFKCLPFEMFMQYQRNGIVLIDQKFATRVVHDFSNSEKTFNQKVALIKTLPRDKAITVLDNWSHPKAQEMLLKLLPR